MRSFLMYLFFDRCHSAEMFIFAGTGLAKGIDFQPHFVQNQAFFRETAI